MLFTKRKLKKKIVLQVHTCGPGPWHSPGTGYMWLYGLYSCPLELAVPSVVFAQLSLGPRVRLPAGQHLHKYNTWGTAWECWGSEIPSDSSWDLTSLMLFSAQEVTAAPTAITRLLVMASCGWLLFWTGRAVSSLHSTLTRPSWENDLILVCYIFFSHLLFQLLFHN